MGRSVLRLESLGVDGQVHGGGLRREGVWASWRWMAAKDTSNWRFADAPLLVCLGRRLYESKATIDAAAGSNLPVVFQKEVWHSSCWNPK